MSHGHAFEFTDAPEVGRDDHVAHVPAGITSAQALLQVLYNALELPGYFGFNWDALSDCLRDFHWLNQHRTVLRHADLPPMPIGDLGAYLEVPAEAESSWGPGEQHSLKVVFPAATHAQLARVMATEGP
jgi:hypothetical protein